VLRDAGETVPGATLGVRLWRGSIAARVTATTPGNATDGPPRDDA
jgi:hypothetical protein